MRTIIFTNRIFKRLWLLLTIGLGLCVAAILGTWHLQLISADAQDTLSLRTEADKGITHILRYDPQLDAFQTYTTAGIAPWSIAVTEDAGVQNVWYTDAGADKVGCLVYTSSLETRFVEYLLPAGSRPLNIVIAPDDMVWFTEYGRNRIARLDPVTGQIDEFVPTTPDSGPADLFVAADGSIWFTEMNAGQVAQLVVTSTTDYAMTEYRKPDGSLDDGQPYGLVVAGARVFIAQTALDQITIFTPPDSWLSVQSFIPGVPQEPYALALDAEGEALGTERAGNRISYYTVGTLPVVRPYNLEPSGSVPWDLAVDADNRVWVVQWGTGAIVDLAPGINRDQTIHPLPNSDNTKYALGPKGITVEDSGIVWVVASLRHTIHLPLVQKLDLSGEMTSFDNPDAQEVLYRDVDSSGSDLFYRGRDLYRAYLPLAFGTGDARTPIFGIQMYGSLEDTALDLVNQSGAHWVRVPVDWVILEPTDRAPQDYLWDQLDATVQKASQRGIRLILTLSSQPSWAAEYPSGPPYDTADLIEFLVAVVERYDGDGLNDAPDSPQVTYFEIYNEPDNADRGLALDGGWGYWGHQGQAYAALLQTLYPEIKAANAQAQVVFGGIALDWFQEDGGPFDRQFLDDVLAACQGKACFDLGNFHYYPPFRHVWESYGPDIAGKAAYVRLKLDQYGMNSIPIVCTETGLASGLSWGSEELQSRYVVKSMVRTWSANLHSVIWFMLSDSGQSQKWGLVDDNGEPKPAFAVYQNLVQQLDYAVYQRALTVQETGSLSLVGYVFSRPSDPAAGQRLDVLWTEDDTPTDPDDDPQLPYLIEESQVLVVDKFGVETWVNDIDDGLLDGQVKVIVGGSPLYVLYKEAVE